MKKKYKLKEKYKNMLDLTITYLLALAVVLLAIYIAPTVNERVKKKDNIRHIKIEEIRNYNKK